MRVFLFATALTLAVLGCSDGKLNLLLVFWGDSEESSSSRERPPVAEPKSSSSVEKSSSSDKDTPPYSYSSSYSSGEEPPPPLSSSEEQPSVLSSSSKAGRSSSAKTDSNGNTYVDYPALEEGAPGVNPGWATRYWDGCKPHCSWLNHNKNIKPFKICKNCDKDNKEISTYFRHPDWGPYFTGYNSVESSCDGGPAYTCWDMAPFAVNDTLAYGFAAISSSLAECGTCYQLEFDGNWYDEPERPRPTNRAIKGKTMIVMASNIGGEVQYNVKMKDGRIGSQFDIMIPGGGVGAFNSLSGQIGVPATDMGPGFGGLLSRCEGTILPDMGIRDGAWRATLEEWQQCLRAECNRVFGKKPEIKDLLNGCLWHVDWFMAANNPTLHYKKVDCPKYLVNKYASSIDTVPPALPDPYVTCLIQGEDCKQMGWW